MIYGLNFGAPDIPAELRKHFKPRIRRQADSGEPLRVFCLVGVCTSDTERWQMTTQADNGRRLLHWEEKTWTIKQVLGSSTWYAVYAH